MLQFHDELMTLRNENAQYLRGIEPSLEGMTGPGRLLPDEDDP